MTNHLEIKNSLSQKVLEHWRKIRNSLALSFSSHSGGQFGHIWYCKLDFLCIAFVNDNLVIWLFLINFVKAA